jgi:hypothetical protein
MFVQHEKFWSSSVPTRMALQRRFAPVSEHHPKRRNATALNLDRRTVFHYAFGAELTYDGLVHLGTCATRP